MTQFSSTHGSGIDRYFQAMQNLQQRVIESQRPVLMRAARQMAETIRGDGRIFVFGTGHSHLMAEEAFYRAGGLAAVVPVMHSAIMVHENPVLSGRLERSGGLAEILLAQYDPRPGEMIFIYSNSGVNCMPVEMALQAKALGLFSVSISSLAYARVAPLSEAGLRLDQAVDLAIDNCGEPGDALVSLEGWPWRAGPSSTLIGALIWNCLVAETAQRLLDEGVEPPVFASLNMPGAGEHNQALFEKWKKGNRHF